VAIEINKGSPKILDIFLEKEKVDNGILKVIVLNSRTMEPIPYANILIKHSLKELDFNGTLIIRDIPLGTNTLLAKRDNYISKEVTINIVEDSINELIVRLDELPVKKTFLTGKILDSISGDPIAHADISIFHMKKQFTSGVNGEYSIFGIPVTIDTISVQQFGYNPKKVNLLIF